MPGGQRSNVFGMSGHQKTSRELKGAGKCSLKLPMFLDLFDGVHEIVVASQATGEQNRTCERQS